MSPDVIEALVPKRRGDEISPRIRKGIFAPQTIEFGQSRVTRTTIASATRLPHLLSRCHSRSVSRSPIPYDAGGDIEKASDDLVPKRPYLTMASQKAREAFSHECIRSCALFADRDPAFVQQLMHDFHIQLFVAGDVIVNEGDSGDTMYFIRRGEVEVCIGEQQTVVRTLGDGSIFGELSLLGVSQKRTATVRATTFCDCRVMSHSRFKQILHGFPNEHSFFTQLAAERRDELRRARRERKRELHRNAIRDVAMARRYAIKEAAEVVQKRKTIQPTVGGVQSAHLVSGESSLVINDFFPSSSAPATRRASWCDMAFTVEDASSDIISRSASASCSRRRSLSCSSASSNDGSDYCLSSTWPSASQDIPLPKRPSSSRASGFQRKNYLTPTMAIDSRSESALEICADIPKAPPPAPCKPRRPSRKRHTFSAKDSQRGLQRGSRSHESKFSTEVLTEVANLYDMRRVSSPESSQSLEPDASRPLTE
mmetsp:Transcript_84988/g.134254  ORF Transcript_84988/g.134254 Transcript_84988/m.134254 type:complete len:483 (-) Transcript_84988:381-1829(-)